MARTLEQLVALVTPRKPRRPWTRTPEEDARIYGPPEFRAWLHRQACMICGSYDRIQQCHAIGGGTGRKADWEFTFPGCKDCHDEHHDGLLVFPNATRETLLGFAAETQRRWAAVSSILSDPVLPS